MRIQLLFLLMISINLVCQAQRIVTWNVKDIFSNDDISSRNTDFERFSKAIKPDIIILQEITSFSEIQALTKAMGWTSYDMAISNFGNDNNSRTSFEVAIISKYPLSNIIEYESITDDRNLNGAKEIKIEDPEIPGFKFKRAGRGILCAFIDDLNLWVSAVHLKSSLGRSGIESDGDNAQKRESVMLGYLEFVKYQRVMHPNVNFLLAGDFNVGHSDIVKNGSDITDDQNDGYDDTHFILKSGLDCKCPFTNLVDHILTSTYPTFEGSPIDNIYTFGRLKYVPAKTSEETFGSDHLAVYTEILR